MFSIANAINCKLLLTVSIYAGLSIIVFKNVFANVNIVIDEAFHVPQGLAYCNKNFSYYDPKITTLPGLYLFSMVILPSCTAAGLRFTNVIGGIVNVVIYYFLRKELGLNEHNWKDYLHCFNIALLPPLFFFSHLYYTDVISLSVVLGMILFSIKGHLSVTFLLGIFAVLMRQTNILFVAFIAGIQLSGMLFTLIFDKRKFPLRKFSIQEKDVVMVFKNLRYIKSQIFQLNMGFFIETACYLTLFIMFCSFVVWNGGIVVGDKTAHVATLHTPQVFYYSLFALFFGWPFFILNALPFLKWCSKKYVVTISLILFIMYEIYMHTLIHPYLLADNRHYIFYVWKRFFGTSLMRYLWSPVYLFSLYTIFQKIYDSKDIRFSVFYIPTVILVLCFQGLLEIRYFIPPYVLFRLNLRNVSYKQLIAELIFFIFINIATLYLFVTKEIYWSDIPGVQHLIW